MIYLFLLAIFIFLLYHFFYHYKFKRSLFFDNTYHETTKTYVKKIETNVDNNLYVHQTYFDKSKIPQDIFSNIKEFAPEYKHVIYDDEDIVSFLSEYFEPQVLTTFQTLSKGAHKADLARYCILYIYGGIYLDIKSELIMPLSDIFTDNNTFYTVISCDVNITMYQGKSLYQGIISSRPNNPLFLSLINYIITCGDPLFYHDFCMDMYTQIYLDINDYVQHTKGLPNYYMNDNNLSQGVHKGTYQTYHLFEEKCSSDDDSMCYDGFDRYHLCCFVWDGNKPIIKTRRSSYPWT
jgi:hypothetical protein